MAAFDRNLELSARQRRAIVTLLESRTIGEAALKAGVGERSVRRWLENPQFREALKAAQREVFEGVMMRLQGLASEAAETLRTLLQAESEPVRLGAVRTVLEHAAEAGAIAELEERLRRVEGRGIVR